MMDQKMRINKINVEPKVKYFIVVNGGPFVHCCTMGLDGCWIKADHVNGDKIIQPYEVSTISEEEATEILSTPYSLRKSITCRKSLKTYTILKKDLTAELIRCQSANQKFETLFITDHNIIELHASKTSFISARDGEEYYDLHRFSLGKNNVINEEITMAWGGQKNHTHERTSDDTECQM